MTSEELDTVVAGKGEDVVYIDYTNHRGERTEGRAIIPKGIRFAMYEWDHVNPKARYILDAYDIGKDADRSFDILKIEHWRTTPERQDSHRADGLL